jgi:hypothetical protein
MCGICGFIGRSKCPKITFDLATALFEKSESRGLDASGFWGTEPDDGKIVYHKEPIEATKFVKKPIWTKAIQSNPDVFLLHARDATPGVGNASINKNNHPFVNSDYSVGLIHNGRIPESEYSLLTKKYNVISTCDSEILLRIFEAGKSYDEEDIETELLDNGRDQASRLMGIRDIWSSVSVGSRRSMAVAIGERLPEGHRRLWLFRNHLRTLWLVDLREALGQYFFVSTDDIWQEAIQSLPEVQNFLRKSKKRMIEIPTDEAWVLETSPEEPIVTDENFHRYSIEKVGIHEWEHQGSPIRIPLERPITDIVGELGTNEEVRDLHFNSEFLEVEPQKLIDLCQNIQQNGVELEAYISKYGVDLNIDCVHDQLKQIDVDLRGVLRSLEQ